MNNNMGYGNNGGRNNSYGRSFPRKQNNQNVNPMQRNHNQRLDGYRGDAQRQRRTSVNNPQRENINKTNEQVRRNRRNESLARNKNNYMRSEANRRPIREREDGVNFSDARRQDASKYDISNKYRKNHMQGVRGGMDNNAYGAAKRGRNAYAENMNTNEDIEAKGVKKFFNRFKKSDNNDKGYDKNDPIQKN